MSKESKFHPWREGTLEDWLLEELELAYRAARKHKRGTDDEHEFELNAAKNLVQLRDDIISRRYKPSAGIAFIIFQPVVREIFAAPFRDRVVHHLVYNGQYDWFNNHMIANSFSCREDKGTLKGVLQLQKAMRKVSKGGKVKAYVIKLDLSGYFMSMIRKILYERVCWGLDRQFAQDKGQVYRLYKYLWRQIIFDDPTDGVKRRGKLSDWQKLPENKSLFAQTPGQGIVIGNLSSQLLSNILLDQLDRFVTMVLGYKYYGRYVDDFYIVVTEDELLEMIKNIKRIEEFLAGMGLKLHPKKRYIQPVEHGVEFLGVRVYPNRLMPGKRLKRNFRKAVHKYMMGIVEKETIVSYLGHLRHLDSDKFIERTFAEVGWV